jgi:hypothetical protein
MKEVAITIRMNDYVWEKFRSLVLIEKGEAVGNIEEKLVSAREATYRDPLHDAGETAMLNVNPVNVITRNLVELVYNSGSFDSSLGDDVWDVFRRLVIAADPDCDRDYELTPTAKPIGNDHPLLGKRMRIKTLADADQYYHRVVRVSDQTGQTLIKLGDVQSDYQSDYVYGIFVPEVLAVHPVDSGELTDEQWQRLKRLEPEDIPF